MTQYIKGFLKSCARKSFFVATPVHPLPYKIAARQVKTIYPAPGIPTPPQAKALMDSLAGSLGLKAGSASYGKEVGWIVQNSPQERNRILNSKDPYVKFYREENPLYVEGHGLMTLIPFTIQNGLYAVGKIAGRKYRKMWRRMRCSSPILQALPKLRTTSN